ncbi:MAG: SusC/RagA family TonB-linked outer membrane protein [Bacteroides sp.]|nr:SusC/RagA family TonB-linked outer membrane protein [Bacteroides sp.]
MPKNKKECGSALRVAVAAATLITLGSDLVLNAQTALGNGRSVPATGMALAQSTASIITGKVIDAQGEPLAGAAVVTDSKGLGALTNADGVYVIKVPSSTKVTTVTASFVGMKPLTQPVPSDGKPLDFTLSEDGNQLNEVVVTGLFDRKASSFTGSAATYSAEDLKLGGNQNVIKSLQNLDPSFITNNYSTNGSNPNALDDISLRGNASFSGLQGDYSGNPNEPLFILDGFETSAQTIFDLDMNRVKSVTILKDAAAKAIYGSKAANGVIVVETYEPEAGRIRLTYTGDLNIESADLSSYDMCNAAEKLQVELNAGRFDSSSPTYAQALREQYNAIAANVARGVDTDWLSKPLRTGIGQKHSLYLEGGSQEMRYGATVTYNKVAGVMKGSDRENISGNINLSYKLRNFLFRNSFTITSNRADNSPYGTFGDFISVNPYYAPVDETGAISKVLGTFTPGGYNASPVIYYNPLYNATLGTKNFGKYTEYTENFYIEYRPIDEIRLTGRLGYTHQNSTAEDFKPGDHTSFATWTGDQFFKRGSYRITDGEVSNLSADITASYTKQWNKQMLIVNGAWSLNSSSSQSHGMEAWGFTNNHVDYITFAKQYAENGRPFGSEGKTRSIGITGAANYSYADRYLVDASIRYNGSSIFGSDSRWGTFWSAGLGWNLHNEPFMQSATWLNRLKLRGSYGLTGNQNFNPYQAKATYTFFDDIIYDNITGAYLMAIANDKLKWQQTADLNLGLDFQAFDRINLRAEWYNSKSKDALIALTLPTSTGFTSYMENLGNVENKGFEATLSYKIFQKRDSYFSVMASVAHNQNKITSINDALSSFNKETDSENSTTPRLRYAEGQSMTAIWAVRSLGIDPANGRELFLKKDGVTTTYDYSTDDYVICGDSNPKYHGTFGFNGEIKGIGLNAIFSYQLGGDYYNQTLVDRVENVNIANNVDRRVLTDTWNSPGDRALYKHITSTPSTTYATSRFIQRNNQLQLSSVNLYYDFKNQPWLRSSRIERLRLAFYMNDVFHISSVKAERAFSYPYARSYSFSASITF